MGLHNKYPSYFYKRGNLFNTYLGGSSEGGEVQAPKRKTRSPQRREPSPALTVSKDPIGQLVAFVGVHLSDLELGRLLLLLGDAVGVQVPAHETSRGRARAAIGPFIRQHVSAKDAERYLEELERRRVAGLPFIRYRKVAQVSH